MPLLVLALVVSAASLDEDPAFREATSLYRELEFERATIRFQEAALSGARSPEDRARLFVWIGLCYAQLGDLTGARRAFDDAVRQDPAVVMPADAPPKITEMLEAARRGAPRPETTTSTTDPAPAPTADPASADPASAEPASAEPAARAGSGALAWTLGGAGIALLVAAGVAGAVGLVNVGEANDPGTTQIDVVRARDAANLSFWVAGVGAVVGAGLTSGALLLPGAE